MQKVKESYPSPANAQAFASDEYYWLNNCLKDAIQGLVERKENKAQVML